MDIDIDDETHKLQDCKKANIPVGTTDEFFFPRLKRLCLLNDDVEFDPTTYLKP